jgi:hypothetical protein
VGFNRSVRTCLLFFNQLDSLFGCHHLAFTRLGGFAHVEALLASLLGLDHLVLQHCLQHVVPLVIIIDAGCHLAGVCFATRVDCVRKLFTREAVSLPLELDLQLVEA